MEQFEKLRIVSINTQRKGLDELIVSLGFGIDESHTVDTFSPALALFVSAPVDICLISHDFTKEVVDTFLSDSRKTENNKLCAFMEVLGGSPSDEYINALKGRGFTYAMAASPSPKEKEILVKVLSGHLEAKKILAAQMEKAGDTANMLMGMVDEVAQARKRGRKASFFRSIFRLAQNELHGQEDVFNHYVEALTKSGAQKRPDGFKNIAVPEEVLSKNLPGLSSTTYVGASSRVWKFLSKKFKANG